MVVIVILIVIVSSADSITSKIKITSTRTSPHSTVSGSVAILTPRLDTTNPESRRPPGPHNTTDAAYDLKLRIKATSSLASSAVSLSLNAFIRSFPFTVTPFKVASTMASSFRSACTFGSV